MVFSLIGVLFGGCAQGGLELSNQDSDVQALQSTRLKMTTWNIEWFGAPSLGPSDDDLQVSNVVDVMSELKSDLLALQEVVSVGHFEDLLAEFTHYEGLVANDNRLEGAGSYYSREQKPALIWNTEKLELLDAKVILTENDSVFAGRPPLEARFLWGHQNAAQEIAVITFHAKAFSDESSWLRRSQAASVLGQYVKGLEASLPVVVLGDFNDDLDESIAGQAFASPYLELLDIERMVPVTLPLSLANTTTTVNGSKPVDHIVMRQTDSARAAVDGLSLFRPEAFVDSYADSTSDHYPVSFLLESNEFSPDVDVEINSTEGQATLILTEILANERGSDATGEFVEIYNPTDLRVNLEGMKIEDSLTIRHVFSNGAQIEPEGFLVVSAGESYSGNTVTTEKLGLNNVNDRVRLTTREGEFVDEFGWMGSTDGVSFTRMDESSKDSEWVEHTLFESFFSPGRWHN